MAKQEADRIEQVNAEKLALFNLTNGCLTENQVVKLAGLEATGAANQPEPQVNDDGNIVVGLDLTEVFDNPIPLRKP